MKKLENFKGIFVILLSAVMVIALSINNVVRADEEDDLWGTNDSSDSTWETPSLENTAGDSSNSATLENTVVNESNSSANNATNTSSNNSVVFNTSLNNATTNNATTNKSNSTTSNANSLAKTGVEDSTGIFAMILVIAVIVAAYSLKKVRDYKDM